MTSYFTSEVKPTSTTQLATEHFKTMRAVIWNAKEDVRVVDKPKPAVMGPHDALIRVTSTTICGSDLHLYHSSIPGMKSGDILGHECMGFVEDVGPSVQKIQKGQRVVVSAVIADGKCEFCKKEKYSLCDTTNPSGELDYTLGGHRTAEFFGYSHLTGGFPGGQAEFIRVPYADVNCLPVPDTLTDEKALFLSDVLTTGWHANELGQVGKDTTVAIWGAGPIGLTCAAWAKFRGASKIIIVDTVNNRLTRAKDYIGCDTINFTQEDPKKTILRLIPGGPDVCIDAVGFRYAKSWTHTIEKFLKMETDANDSLSEAIFSVRKGGTVVVVGDYIGTTNHFPIGAIMEKGITLTGSQVFVQKYWHKLLSIIENGEFDVSFLATSVMPLEKASDAYKIFDQKREDGIKIILKPDLYP